MLGNDSVSCVVNGLKLLIESSIGSTLIEVKIKNGSLYLVRRSQEGWRDGESSISSQWIALVLGMRCCYLGKGIVRVLMTLVLISALRLHANTIPICVWMVMEVLKDPELYRRIMHEVSQARIIDDISAVGTFDHHKLALMPLMQSVYTEILRMHVSILVTRTATEDVMIGGYIVPKGSTLQAPTEVAHLDESICKRVLSFFPALLQVSGTRF